MNQKPRRLVTGRRVWLVGALVLVAAALVPVPFNIVFADEPAAHVWRLDGRLIVNGESANPKGRWSFVAVGRPALLGESVFNRITKKPAARNVRHGLAHHRPVFAEPLAAAAGLNLAGVSVLADPLLIIEARDGLTPMRVAVALNGSKSALIAFRDAAAVMPVESFVTENSSFTLRDGSTVVLTPTELAGMRFRSSEVLTEDVSARIRWRTQRYVPERWFRSLAVGNSHGLMVALVTYATVADADLGQGLHVAGTGAVRTDGTVEPVGAVAAKAVAAHRAKADVFFYPAVFEDTLAALTFDGMETVPVHHLRDAVTWLDTHRQR